jgi:hypothetical protein
VFCLFLVFREISTKQSPNATKLFDDFFRTRETLEASGGDQMITEETGRQQGAPEGVGAPCYLVGPTGLHLT